MATIVFSDGSKRMARNLDDLRLRWHERRNWMADMDREGIAITEAKHDKRAVTKAGLVEIRRELVAQTNALNAELQRMNEIGRDLFSVKKRQAILVAKQQIEAQITSVNGLIKLMNTSAQPAIDASVWIEAQRMASEQTAERAAEQAAETTKRIALREQRMAKKDRAFADFLLREKNAMLAELKRLKQLHDETGAIDCVNIPSAGPFVWREEDGAT